MCVMSVCFLGIAWGQQVDGLVLGLTGCFWGFVFFFGEGLPASCRQSGRVRDVGQRADLHYARFPTFTP